MGLIISNLIVYCQLRIPIIYTVRNFVSSVGKNGEGKENKKLGEDLLESDGQYASCISLYKLRKFCKCKF